MRPSRGKKMTEGARERRKDSVWTKHQLLVRSRAGRKPVSSSPPFCIRKVSLSRISKQALFLDWPSCIFEIIQWTVKVFEPLKLHWSQPNIQPNIGRFVTSPPPRSYQLLLSQFVTVPEISPSPMSKNRGGREEADSSSSGDRSITDDWDGDERKTRRRERRRRRKWRGEKRKDWEDNEKEKKLTKCVKISGERGFRIEREGVGRLAVCVCGLYNFVMWVAMCVFVYS